MSSTAKKRQSAASSSKRSKKSNGKPRTPEQLCDSKTAEGWRSWSRHLAERKRPVAISKLVPHGKKSPLLWAITAVDGTGTADELVRLLGDVAAKPRTIRPMVERLESWLDHAQTSELTASFGYECLAWCHALPKIACELAAGPWWQLFEKLLEVADESNVGNQRAADPLADQLLAGELPLTLAYLFPEIDHCVKLAKPALQNITQGIADLLDGEGLPQARHLSLLRPLMASWTRVNYFDRDMGRAGIEGDTALQFEWLVRQAMRTSRYDGSQMLIEPGKASPTHRLFQAALALIDDPDDLAIADVALPSRRSTASRIPLPESDAHCQWANIAVLRSTWSRSANRLLVTYGPGELRSELCAGRNEIWSGNCDPRVQVDGQVLSPSTDWEEVCWHTDEDVSYVELECELSEGWKIQRQWLLARSDGFLYVADAVIGERSSQDRIEYRCKWPLVEQVRFAGAVETREGSLDNGKPIARVIPLALPEWRAERLDASLAGLEGGLQLFQTARGSALHAPLFIDLNVRRVSKPLTWRQLTVAERLEIQPRDVAVGYRVQVGKSQWLIYRSLAAPANRTVLGQNFSTEMHVGRFKKTGVSEELLEIE